MLAFDSRVAEWPDAASAPRVFELISSLRASNAAVAPEHEPAARSAMPADLHTTPHAPGVSVRDTASGKASTWWPESGGSAEALEEHTRTALRDIHSFWTRRDAPIADHCLRGGVTDLCARHHVADGSAPSTVASLACAIIAPF
jgi:hypothetical protein